MTLRDQLVASVEMVAQHTAYDDECAALAHLARSESRWALWALRDGKATDAAVYRSRARFHLGKAHEKRALARAVRQRKLRVVQ